MFRGDGINKAHEPQQQPERWSEVKGRRAEKTLADFGGILYIISLEAVRGSSSVWLERLPVTQEAASSSLVYPAKAQPPSKK
jgi:hypothetical protein